MGIAHQFIDETVSAEGIKALVELRPWMRYKRLELIDRLDALDKFVEEACEKKCCVIDLETDGLDTGPGNRGRGSRVASIAGFCLSYHKDYGVYIPVAHLFGKNLPLNAVLQRIKKIVAECLTIYHNFKYDGELLRNHGIVIEDPKKYRDTLLGAAVLFSDRKAKGLKILSKDLLGKEMIELSEIVPNKANIDFKALHPKDAVFYGASDGVCTMELYEYEMDLLNKWDPQRNNGTFFTYEVEHACQLVVMEMERNLVKIDIDYYQGLATEVETRMVSLEDEIFAAAGEVFEISSNKQLGAILFDKLKLPYPLNEKSKTDEYFVKDEVLEVIANKHALPRLIQEYREMGKVYSTYLLNLLKNVDANSCVKFNMNQTAADSGRFSSTGGKGLTQDGYSGVNCQNIPAVKDGDHWKLRKGIIARPGFKIVTIDYSGEELRIATNFSKEKVWVEEFNHGTGDLHSITAAMLFGGKPSDMTLPEHKWKRKIAKSVNFLILYGGGASKLAASANIPLHEAQERLENFFTQMTMLTEWMKIERIRARRRGYSLTAFGRRRPLEEMYKSGDRGLISKADRLAVNAAIQGTGADIIKIALYRVWSYIKKNNLQDDVKILMPIHDEIVYEMRDEKLDVLIPAISEIMKIRDLTKSLKWAVQLEVDAEYDDTFMVKKNYFEDLREGITAAVRLGMEKSPEETPSKKAPEAIPESERATTLERGNYETEMETPIPVTIDGNKTSKNTIESSLESQGQLLPLSSDTEEVFEAMSVDKSSSFYSYEVSKSDKTARALTDTIWTALEGIDHLCNPEAKKRIRLTRNKEVLYTTEKAFSVEGFLSLAYMLSI